MCLVPILRSGLAWLKVATRRPPRPGPRRGEKTPLTASQTAFQTLLPEPVAVHHLGLYREPSTLQPVEYYNNLPNLAPGPEAPGRVSLAIVLDPVIATGGTCAAAIQTLREWGVERIVVVSVLAALPGVQRAAAEWPDSVDIWVAGLDKELTDLGMLKPGLGDVGDRLFLTIGK